MKKTISITLPSAVLAKIDQLTGPKSSRSAFIECVLRSYLREPTRRNAHARDVELINAAAERLNAEAEDVLSLQN